MLKRMMIVMLTGLMAINLSGCFLLAAGVVGGAGTAVWLSGKLTQEFHAPYHRTIDAADEAMHAMGLQITSETQNDNAAQIKGLFSDGKEIWIDIKRVGEDETRVDVRVGGVNPDKDAAGVLLNRIEGSL